MPRRWWYFEKARAPFKSHFCDWIVWCVWPFLSSHGMKYILVAVDHVSKWVEAIALANNEGKSVIAFLKKNIFSRFGIQGLLLVMGDPTFATNCLKDYWRNMGFSIMCPLLTILKLVGKLRCQIGRLSIFCQKYWMLVEWIGQGGLIMFFGPTWQYIRFP